MESSVVKVGAVNLKKTDIHYKKQSSFFSNIHRIYLILSVILGLAIAIGMPLFNEPDGEYHYQESSVIVGLTNDLGFYGENANAATGMDGQSIAIQKGDYFRQYYLNTVYKIPMKSIPRTGMQSYPSVLSYNFWGHLLPAIGLWIGYHIYPSMGVMIICGRIFSILVLSSIMYFVIKSLKYGKFIFLTVFLSPVVLNQMASLSYDGLAFVLVGITVAFVINLIAENKNYVSLKNILKIIGIILSMIIMGKSNYIIVLGMLPIVYISKYYVNKHREISESFSRIRRNNSIVTTISRYKRLIIILMLVVFALLSVYFTGASGGLVNSVYRIFQNIVFAFRPQFTVSSSASILAIPYPEFNSMPIWIYVCWLVALFMVLFVEDKFIKSKIISYGSLALFFISALAVLQAFANLILAFTSRQTMMGILYGWQGRYITPLLLLLLFFVSGIKEKISGIEKKTVYRYVVILAIFSIALMIYDTWFNLMFIL